MDTYQFVASLVSSLVWPVVVLILVVMFRKQVGELIERLRTVKALGAEGTFDAAEQDAKASVALSTATTTAAVQAAQATSTATFVEGFTGVTGTTFEPFKLPSPTQITERLMDLAQRDPQAAVLEAYAEVERALKRRLVAADVPGVEKLQGQRLVDVALAQGLITRETATSLRGILVLRNLAAHDRDVGFEKAVDYLSLADAVIYSIEVARAYVTTFSTGVGTAHDATVKVTKKP